MKAANNREYMIKFRLSEAEKAHIDKNFELSKLENKSDFIRRQAIFGKVYLFDNNNFDFIKRQLIGACGNINQIAHIANIQREVSAENMEELHELKGKLETILFAVNELQQMLKQRV
jgi:hypothetical protein